MRPRARTWILVAVAVAAIVGILLLVLSGRIWHSQTHTAAPDPSMAALPMGTSNPALPVGTSQASTSSSQLPPSSTTSFGTAECPSVVTTTAANGAGLVSDRYSLYENTTTGISFCYPSYLTIRDETSTRSPIPLITWPTGEVMEFYPSQELFVVANSLTDRLLIASCAHSGSAADLECVSPKDYQVIHAKNQNGLAYTVFWSDLVNLDTEPTLVVNSSTGPFAYVNTPGDPLVFVPDVSAPPSVPVLQDLTVILNTLSVSKPL